MTVTDIASTQPTTRPCIRRTLTIAAAAMLTSLVAHIAAAQTGETPQAHHGGPARLIHIIGVFALIALLVAAWRRTPRAALFTLVAGASAAVSMLVLHIVPIETEYTAFYSSQASVLQWATVAAVLVSGLVGAVVGWQRRNG